MKLVLEQHRGICAGHAIPHQFAALRDHLIRRALSNPVSIP